jgi:hypothetical protein
VWLKIRDTVAKSPCICGCGAGIYTELQYLMDQTEQAKETHRMEIVNDIYKKLHDLDYFLLRYGPKDVAKYVEDDSTVSKYYGTLPFY